MSDFIIRKTVTFDVTVRGKELHLTEEEARTKIQEWRAEAEVCNNLADGLSRAVDGELPQKPTLVKPHVFKKTAGWLPTTEMTEAVRNVFLRDPTREYTISEVAKIIGRANTTTSSVLRKMWNDHAVSLRQDGLKYYYKATPSKTVPVKQSAIPSVDQAAGPEPNLDALRDSAEKERTQMRDS